MPIHQASQIIATHYNHGISGLSSEYPECTYEELTDLIDTAWETLEREAC